MKRFFPFIPITLFLTGLFLVLNGFSQRNEYVNQVIIVNSGKYETTPPFTDYVTVQSYDPTSQAVNVFGTIYTQSAQDVVILGNKAWVAAQDSIVLYNIDTYQRIAAIADSGISRIYPFEGKLAVTKKFPIKRFFVEILDAENLALLGLVQNISGDCGEAIFLRDTLYVAVNGGTTGTHGKLAVISKNTWILQREIDFGTNALGITNLFAYNNTIYTVNKTPAGGGSFGSLTIYNPNTCTFTNKTFNLRIGEGYGIQNNLLYLGINYGIGSFDMNSQTIADTTIIQDPGSLSNVFINSAAVDYLNSYLYVNIGNRPPVIGIGIVATTQGDSITSYNTGLNADAIAIDYRSPASIGQPGELNGYIILYPNPATDILSLKSFGNTSLQEVTVSDLTGRIVYQSELLFTNHLQINIKSLPSGIFFVTVITNQGKTIRKFVKL